MVGSAAGDDADNVLFFTCRLVRTRARVIDSGIAASPTEVGFDGFDPCGFSSDGAVSTKD